MLSLKQTALSFVSITLLVYAEAAEMVYHLQQFGIINVDVGADDDQGFFFTSPGLRALRASCTNLFADFVAKALSYLSASFFISFLFGCVCSFRDSHSLIRLFILYVWTFALFTRHNLHCKGVQRRLLTR